MASGEAEYYARRAEQELALAARAVDTNIKVLHLNTAAIYATLRERSSEPHRGEAEMSDEYKNPSSMTNQKFTAEWNSINCDSEDTVRTEALAAELENRSLDN